MNVINSIKAIIILSTDGRRTLVKYYDEQMQSNSKLDFEKKLYSKTKSPKAKDEIIELDGVLVVHKFITDSHIYVVGDRNENPLVLDSVLSCLVEIFNSLSSNVIGGNLVHDNSSRVVLALDEICDSGMILETDPNLVLQRITATNQEDFESVSRTAKRFGNWFGI